MADVFKAEREPKSRQSHSTREEVRKVEPTETSGVRTDELPAPMCQPFATGHRRIGAGRRQGAVGGARRGRTRRATSWSPDLMQS